MRVSAFDLPWNQAGFAEYNESPRMPFDTSLGEPRKYSLAATPLPAASPAQRPEAAVLIARLPEHAVFWVEGTRTRSLGRTRYFQSPPLQPGLKYSYTVRAAWIEDGDWVSQTQKVPVQTGLIAVQALTDYAVGAPRQFARSDEIDLGSAPC